MNTTSTVTVTDKEINFVNNRKVVGANKSYYNELFSSSTTEDVRKKDLEEQYNTKLKKGVKLVSAKLIKNETFDDSIEFETQLQISEKIKSVGNLKIIDIPFIDKVYTRDVIAQETRNYDIDYASYENNLDYNTAIFLNIPEDKKFTEVPENKTYKYKNHNYAISFELVKPNSLKITRIVKASWDNISVAEYPEFKQYIEDVLANEEQVVGFK